MHPAKTYYLIKILNMAGMSMTMTSYSPYLLTTLDISAAEIALLNALFQFTIFFCEIPTGMMADGRGRAWSVRMSLGFHMAGMAAYAVAQGFWTALLAEVLEGVAFAFISGALSSWIADALIKRQEPERLRTVLATDALLCAGTLVVTSQIGHFLSLLSFRLPWASGCLLQASALVVAIRCLNGDGEPVQRLTEREALRQAWQHVRHTPGLRWGATVGIVFGLAIPFNHFWSPYFRTYVPEIFIGAIWMPLYLALFLSGWLARRGAIRERGGDLVLLAMLALTGISLALINASQALAPAMFAAGIHEMARGIFRPQMELYFQRQFKSSFRATASSILSFIQTCGSGLILLGVWFAMRGVPATRDSIGTLWAWCGTLMAMSALLLFLLKPRRTVPAPAQPLS